MKKFFGTFLVVLSLAFFAFGQTTVDSASVTTPIPMTLQPQQTGTTHNGISYVMNSATGESDKDAFLLMVTTYQGNAYADIEGAAQGIIESATLVHKSYTTVSGYRALELTVDQGDLRVMDLIVARGAVLYQVMYIFHRANGLDVERVTAYYQSFTIK